MTSFDVWSWLIGPAANCAMSTDVRSKPPSCDAKSETPPVCDVTPPKFAPPLLLLELTSELTKFSVLVPATEADLKVNVPAVEDSSLGTAATPPELLRISETTPNPDVDDPGTPLDE